MGAYFALSALGVDPQVIRQDYLMTNDVIAPKIAQQSAAAKDRGLSQTFITNMRALYTVSPDYFDAATKIVNTQYGGAQDYLRDVLGLSGHDITDLKRLYLD